MDSTLSKDGWVTLYDPVTKEPTTAVLLSEKAMEVYKRTGEWPRRMNQNHIHGMMDLRRISKMEF